MASKGTSRHMKRLASPKYMKLRRKVAKFVTKPNPGRHTLESSLALSTFIKEKLMLAKNTREAQKAIKGRRIEVNGKVVVDPKYPIGFGDIVRIVPSNEKYDIEMGKYGLFDAKKSTGKDTKRTLKVIGKYLGKKGKTMIRLNNGNIMQAEGKVSVNDSVVTDGKKILDVVKFEKGAKCMVIKGIHAPETGKIKQIEKGSAQRDATVEIESSNGSFQTLVKNVMAVGA